MEWYSEVSVADATAGLLLKHCGLGYYHAAVDDVMAT